MYTAESLLDKYGEKIIIVNKKHTSLNVLKIFDNYENSPIKLHVYEVIRNDKSGSYYEETLGLVETNSEPLYKDHVMFQRVTQQDLQEKNE